MLLLPIYSPPRILFDLPPILNADMSIWSKIFHPEVVRKLKEGEKIGGTPFNGNLYARMFAKIAHSAAIAMMGPSFFKPFLPDVILGKINIPFHFVGCLENQPSKPESHTHTLYFEKATFMDKQYLLASLRLFAYCGAPTYHIVVGSIAKNPFA